MLDSRYVDQVALLIDLLPAIASNSRFAIKGRAAINLFLLDLPRLSVDIDLCYALLTSKDQTLSDSNNFLKNLTGTFSAIGLHTRSKKCPMVTQVFCCMQKIH